MGVDDGRLEAVVHRHVADRASRLLPLARLRRPSAQPHEGVDDSDAVEPLADGLVDDRVLDGARGLLARLRARVGVGGARP